MSAVPHGSAELSSAIWVDSHCHIQGLDEREADEVRSRVPADEPMNDSSEVGDSVAVTAGPIEDVVGDREVERALAAGVATMVCVGTDPLSSRRAVELAGRRSEVWATVGLHPHDASSLEVSWSELERLARSPRVVGIGETGFDLFYEHSSLADQEAAFRRQICLAHERELALVIHTRDAWDDTFRVLEAEGVPERTIVHCFSGGPAEAERALAVGAHLSFSGIVTFPKADEVREAARITPLSRMLVETDAPFLTPVPHRGKVNEPAYVPFVGAVIADALGRPIEEVAAATTANAHTVFRLSGKTGKNW